MIDLFPLIYAKLKADPAFSGFTDAAGRFKVFREDENPTIEGTFVTIAIEDGGQQQLTKWAKPRVTFHCWGKDTQWATLHALAESCVSILREDPCFDDLDYVVLGEIIYGTGRNPVTNLVVRSASVRLGFGE